MLLTIGRQEPAKDHLTLVRAFAEVLTDTPEALLVMVGGEGNASPAIRSLIDELGLRDRVRQLGVRADIGDLLVAADVFVLSSRWEGLPGAAIEALALGTPIVACDIPATRDVVGANGLLVPTAAATAPARAVADVLEHPDAAKARADSGRADFDTRFTTGAMLEGMAGLYRDTATRRRR
jgi:glycosyltransferase involved in cell wall biosynthesis